MFIRKGLNANQVMLMLNQALVKEKERWKPCAYLKFIAGDKESEVTAEKRELVVRWLVELTELFRFMPETLFLAVSLLDDFLQGVRAHPRYLRCIAVSCFYVSAKVTEEEEIIPSVSEVVDISHCGCSVSDLLRMERIVLSKLLWDLKRVTTLDFLHIFHSLLVMNCPGIYGNTALDADGVLLLLAVKLKACLPFHQLLKFRPSVVAVSFISLELECYTHDWLGLTIALQKLAEVGNTELIHCKEQLLTVLNRIYGNMKNFRGQPMVCNLKSSEGLSIKPAKRKMEQTDVEDIYDSIKRLYGDDGACVCSSAAILDGLSPIPELAQPTTVSAM